MVWTWSCQREVNTDSRVWGVGRVVLFWGFFCLFVFPGEQVGWNGCQLIWELAVVGTGFIGGGGDQELSSGHDELGCLFDTQCELSGLLYRIQLYRSQEFGLKVVPKMYKRHLKVMRLYGIS